MELAEVRARLAACWKAPVKVCEVYVAHHERVVFATTDPAGRRVVVKADLSAGRIAREVAVTRAAGAAIPAPEILEHLPGLAVLSWLDGEPVLASSPDEHWAAAAEALRRLHDTAPPDGLPGFRGHSDWWRGMRDWLDRVARRCLDLEVLPSRMLDRLREQAAAQLSGPAPPRRLIHGDADSFHWRYHAPTRAAGALDWGESGLGDPVWDLMVLAHWDETRLPVVLDGYRAGPATRQRIERLFEPYRVVRHLDAVDWLVDHGYDPTPTVEELVRISQRD